MQHVGRVVERVENLVSFSALGVLFLAVLWGVLTRYVTERPAVWTTELSGILFTWVAFVGAAKAFQHDEHIRISLLVDMLPERAAKIVRLACRLLVLAFLVYLTYLSWVMMGKGATRLSPVLRIPFTWVYLATVLCFAIMSINAILRLVGIVPEPEAHGPGEEVL